MTASPYDVIVIGAGIAGASVAAHLARGCRVLLLEREDFPGYHSTGRSAALFSEIYGNAVVRALSRASRAFFYAPPQEFASGPLVRLRGSMFVAHKSQLRRLEDFAATPDLSGSIRRIGIEEALRACPILRPDYVSAALMEDDAADVDVNVLHQGYLRQFRGAGGLLITNADVRDLTYRVGCWHVATGDDAYRAPVVVNAAGAWADMVASMAGAAPLQIQACRRTAILVELPKGTPPDAWPMVIDIDETFYMKPDSGMLLISPADETPVPACDAQAEEIDVAIGIDRVERATTLKIDRIRKRWAGLRSFAPDRSPIIGFDASMPGFFWLAAQGGYGIQTAPAAARLAAALVRGTQPDGDIAAIAPLVSPRRFAAKTAARSGT